MGNVMFKIVYSVLLQLCPVIYTCSNVIIIENMPTGYELKWLSKRGVGVFSRVVIFLLKLHPPHTHLTHSWSSQLLHAVILQCLFICLCKYACLHLLVPPLTQYCCFFSAFRLYNCTYYTIKSWHNLERKVSFVTTLFKRGEGDGLILERGAYFQAIIVL